MTDHETAAGLGEQQRCHLCGPGYWMGDDGCRHTPAASTDPAPEGGLAREQLGLVQRASTRMRVAWQMNEDADPAEAEFYVAVADWLDAEDTHQWGPPEHAINVAASYLGERTADYLATHRALGLSSDAGGALSEAEVAGLVGELANEVLKESYNGYYRIDHAILTVALARALPFHVERIVAARESAAATRARAEERERIAQAIEEIGSKHPNQPCACRGCSAFRYAAHIARGDAPDAGGQR